MRQFFPLGITHLMPNWAKPFLWSLDSQRSDDF